MIRALCICIAMGFSVLASWAIAPVQERGLLGEVRFAELIPREFGEWRDVPSVLAHVDVAVRRDLDDEGHRLYDEVVNRSYANATGEVIMLSVAYGRRQRQELKIHRPELCYAAQGLEPIHLRRVERLELGQGRHVVAHRFVATGLARVEAVTYWIRIGSTTPGGATESRLVILGEGLRGVVPDGVLVRTSELLRTESQADEPYERQRAFAADLLASLDAGSAELIVPTHTR